LGVLLLKELCDLLGPAPDGALGEPTHRAMPFGVRPKPPRGLLPPALDGVLDDAANDLHVLSRHTPNLSAPLGFQQLLEALGIGRPLPSEPAFDEWARQGEHSGQLWLVVTHEARPPLSRGGQLVKATRSCPASARAERRAVPGEPLARLPV